MIHFDADIFQMGGENHQLDLASPLEVLLFLFFSSGGEGPSAEVDAHEAPEGAMKLTWWAGGPKKPISMNGVIYIYNPCKTCKWTKIDWFHWDEITILIGVITPFITGWGPFCGFFLEVATYLNWCYTLQPVECLLGILVIGGIPYTITT